MTMRTRPVPRRERFHTVKVVQVGREFRVIGEYRDGKRAPVNLAVCTDAVRAETVMAATARMHNAFEEVEYRD